MPKTKRGVYHNLKESKYVVTNSVITFFFSSEHTLNLFMEGYTEFRGKLNKKIRYVIEPNLNFDTLADIEFYKRTERRGFYVWIKGVSVDEVELDRYILRTMTDHKPTEWARIERPRPALRFL